MNEPTTSEWGKVWRITPRRRQQYLWLWACSKAGEKLTPFIFRAIDARVREVVRDRAARGKTIEPWVVAELDNPPVPPLPPFQDVKISTAVNITKRESVKLYENHKEPQHKNQNPYARLG